MRYLRFALCVACLPLAGLRAAPGDEKQEQQAPEEIPNFNQLDEYIYVPKSTLSLGSRLFLKGPRTTYGGQGSNPSTVNPGNDTTVNIPNISRTYIDGTVYPDARTVLQNTGLGGATNVPISPDGRTNTWSYDTATQLLPDGNIAFHTYSAEIIDGTTHDTSGARNTGVELILDRDMGKLGKRMTWSMTAGFAIADIRSSIFASVATRETVLADTYDLFGQVPPAPPFSSPNTVTQTVFGSGGTVVSGTGTTTASQSVTQQILLGNSPIQRSETPVLLNTTNRYFTSGAYYTLRVGPTVTMPFGQHWKLNFSVGPALLYAGSVFNVLEDLQIATGVDFTYLYQKQNTRLVPGYYADLNLQYQLTDTAGFYVGSIFQGAGGYKQTLPSGTDSNGKPLNYTSNIDFGSQEGVKGGMTVRF
jgi:hypothetical protein